MPQLTGQQIADIVFRTDDRVILPNDRIQDNSLKSAFDEFRGLGFEEALISKYRHALNLLVQPDALNNTLMRYIISGQSKDAEIINFPSEIDYKDDFFLGAQLDKKSISATSIVGRLVRFDFQGTLEQEKFKNFRGPRVDSRKITQP